MITGDTKELSKIISASFTIWGVYLLFIKGDITNGLLAMILGESIDYK